MDHRAANILKQEMLSLGGEAACTREVMALKKGQSPVLLLGTESQLQKLIIKLSYQPFGLKEIAKQIKETIKEYTSPRAVRIMGILNVTPDSFSDGGKFLTTEAACSRAAEMVAEGAQLIDIGGESSRPGSLPVSTKEELSRVLPVIKKIKNKIKVPISIDTYKAAVAKACLDNGASIINDISALRFDRQMAGVARRYRAPVILMHMQGRPRHMQAQPHYQDVVKEVFEFLAERIRFAVDQGIEKEKLIIDPGVGFGKTLEHNLLILQKLSEFKSLGCPLLVGASRKALIGKILGNEPGERLNGSLAVVAWSYLNGADLLRVHDVRATVELVKVLKAVRSVKF